MSQLRYRPDPALTAAFYFDFSVGTTTAEWLHSELNLASGESRTVTDVYEFESMGK